MSLGQELSGYLSGREAGARDSGRSTRFVESLKKGDLVVCLTEAQVQEYKSLVEYVGLLGKHDLHYIICGPRKGALSEHVRGMRGRVRLTHCWEVCYYHKAIDDMRHEIAHIERTGI